MKDRRWPWMSGLVCAVIGSVWMVGQVVGGVVSMTGDLISGAGPSFAPVPTQPQP
jgi:hypothetical protein